jgi:hypothetical protein
MTIYRLVQVEHDGDEGLARCRNISDTGMKLDVKMPVAVDDGVKVTFSPTFALSGRVVWLEGTKCGVAFEGKIDCADLLHRSAAEAHADGAREPRLKINLPARVIIDGCSHRTLVSDISQHGMNLTHDGRLRPGLSVSVILRCGAKKAGIVRWANDTFAGLLLSEPFSVDDLGSKHSL